jgi:hypothetical protein
MRRHHSKLRVLRKKAVELFLKGARRRFTGWQLMETDFEYFYLHGFVPIHSSLKPRLTLRKRVCFRVGRFIFIDHENALARIRPASG